MAKKLDLNALEQPTLELTLRDTDKTTFHLLIPTTKLVERFLEASNELKALDTSTDVGTIKRIYQLTAEMVSCNDDGITVTAEELRDKYRVRFGDLLVIYAAYLDFINDIKTAKN